MTPVERRGAGPAVWRRSPFSVFAYVAAVACLGIGVAGHRPLVGIAAIVVAACAAWRQEPLGRTSLVLAVLLVPGAFVLSALS